MYWSRLFARRLCALPYNNAPITGAVGSRGSRGSGQSLMGSRGRGALTAEQLAALEDGTYRAETELDGGDVLMEVLAEDHRRAHRVEFADEELLQRVTDAARGGVGASLGRIGKPSRRPYSRIPPALATQPGWQAECVHYRFKGLRG